MDVLPSSQPIANSRNIPDVDESDDFHAFHDYLPFPYTINFIDDGTKGKGICVGSVSAVTRLIVRPRMDLIGGG